MRAYSAAGEEALHARNLLQDWAREGLLSELQYRLMEPEAACEFRRTNIFLRLVLVLFTLILAGAAAGLFFVLFLSHESSQTTGVFLLIFAALTYAAAELAVSQARLYRYGIEEALAACAVGFLCAGIETAFFSAYPRSPAMAGAEFLVPAAGVLASLWIWHRFGLAYAFFAAMLFALWLPADWTASRSAQHAIVAALYAAALSMVAAVRTRHRFTWRDNEYSIAEALLWLGIYLAINLQLSPVSAFGHWWGVARTAPEFGRPFYWATWGLTWCLPPVVLARGLRLKDRLVMAAGAITATLTLITNKPYLGWPRHTWDPMLLGGLLIAAALLIRRWLARGPDGIRRGFTAQRLSAKDKSWLNTSAAAFGLLTPEAITPAPPAPGFHFGGGDSGGGGASSDF